MTDNTPSTDNTHTIEDVQARIAARRRHNPEPASRITDKGKRSKPAVSAKILATGLSTTAMLGMTAGYAAAAHSKKSPVTPSPVTQPIAATNSGLPSDSSAQGTVGAPALGPLVSATAQTSATPNAPAASSQTNQVSPAAPAESIAPQSDPSSANIASTPVVTAAPQVIEIPVAPPAPADPGNGGGGWNNQPSSGSN